MRLIKKIPLLLGLCVTMTAFAPVNAYAENDPPVDELITKAKEIYQDADSAPKRDRIVELLEEKLDSEDLKKDPTVEGGYKIIDEILKDEKVDLANTMSGVKVQWKKYFKEEAMALGVNFGSTTYESETGDEIVNAGAGDNDAVDAGVKVNILTWNRTKDEHDTAFSKANQGMVSKLLEKVSTEMAGFSDNIRTFAIALAITFGAVSMMNMIQDKNASNEALSREFIKLMIGVWFIYNYKFFALLIIRAGTLILENVIVGVQGSSGAAVKYALVKSFVSVISQNQLATMGSDWVAGLGNVVSDLGSGLSGLFGSITGLFGNGLVQLASSLVVYAVAIEIAIRYLFTPLAIADLYSEKWRSNGWMWLKKLFAVSMQGAVIFLIIYVTDIFKDSLGASFSVITNTAINLTMIGMFAKSRQIANDIIGVH